MLLINNVLIVFILSFSTILKAEVGMNGMISPRPIITYEGRHSNKNNPPSLIDQKISASTPLYRNEQDTYALTVVGAQLHFGQSTRLSSGAVVPSNLYRSEIGLQFSRRLLEKRFWSLKASVGHASDDKFAGTKDATFSLNATYGFPGSGGGYWMLGVFVSNNGPIANYIPIPGAMYSYRTETFKALIGFPFSSLQWTPYLPWSFSLAIFGLTGNLEVAYGAPDKLQFFSGFYMSRQTFIPSVRANEKYRLTFAENKTAIGVRTPISEMLKMEIQLGKASKRSFFEGIGFINKDGGSADLGSTYYTSLNLRVTF
jgi:hypothetical protein